MSETFEPLYGSSNQAITISADGLTNSNTIGRQSAAVDNSSNLYADALVFAKVAVGTRTIGSDKALYVYVYGTVDGGTTYTDGCSGSDAAFTRTDPPNLIPLGTVNITAQSTTNYGGPWSVAARFGGQLPQKWGIVVDNFCGITLSGTSGGSSNQHFYYQGVQSQSNP